MREIPIAFVRANQVGIVLFVVAALLFQEPFILAILLLIQVIGLLTRGKANVFVRIAKPFIRVKSRETQAAELQRFNNVLAVLFLIVSYIGFTIGWSTIGYITSIMLLGAASAALLGYCIGCTIYYQYKRLVVRR